MSFKNNDLKGLQIEFKEALGPRFSASEIRLIWRESLRHFFGITPSDLMLSQDRIFSPDESTLLFKLVNRLNSGEPFQYLIGEVEFYGLPLKVDQRALIPRPETEELVDWIVNRNYLEVSNILDICSGSGCISLALSHHFQKANVLGVEYSKEALELSEENSMALKLPVNFIEGDVLEETSFNNLLKEQVHKNGAFDIVVSNPPYIPIQDKAKMESNVLDYEPELALFVPDEDPLLFYRKISESIFPFLSTNGTLYFECHYLYVEEVRELLVQMGYQHVEKRQDLQGKWRMLKAQKS